MFEYWQAVVGGAILGLAVGAMWILLGKILGCSNFIYQCFTSTKQSLNLVALFFIAGLFSSGLIASATMDVSNFFIKYSLDYWYLLFGGFLVGMGTYIANGCTTGHGLCGLSRFSFRSAIAVGLFFSAAIITAWLVH